MLGNAEYIQVPFKFGTVNQRLKTLYYGQGDNNVKVDIVIQEKNSIASSNTTPRSPPQILKIYELLPISSKIIGNKSTR